MLRRTTVNEYRGLLKMCGGRPHFVVDQPYHLRHSPGNPYFGAQHNHTDPNHNGGFEVKPIHHLRRFQWNNSENGIVSNGHMYRNPGGKTPHWLSINWYDKTVNHLTNHEMRWHAVLAACVGAIVLYQCVRYLFFHPDLTIYNVTFWTLRRWTPVLRNNDIMTLDQPVFRWAQQAPEFYNYHPHRDMFEMGVLANDPYVEYIKSIGREKELSIKPERYGLGEAGRGKLITYLPQMRKDDPKWTNPVKPPKSWYAGPDGHGPHHHGGHGDDHGHGGGHGHGDGHGDHGDHGHGDDNKSHQKVLGEGKHSMLGSLLGGPHKYSSVPIKKE